MAADLELIGVTVQAGEKRLIQDVSLRVKSGEFVALLGPNGAGKTTLLRAALGLARCTGSALLNGRPVREFSGRRRAALLAWLPQQALVTEPLEVLELVAGARYRFAETRAAALEAARQALQRAGAAEFVARIASTLSGGEQQRVAIAALLAQDAPLLLLDEPANHLDPGQQIAIYRLLGELRRQGHGVLCVTHDVNLLSHIGGQVRVVGMAGGRARFECAFDASELADHLGELYGVPFDALAHEGRRVLLARGGP